MPLKEIPILVLPLAFDGPKLITPRRFGDNRGYFFESFRDNWFRENVAEVTFVQDNQSMSVHAGTIRGLHYQITPAGQAKLITCPKGAILDVVVDIRQGSETYGQWLGVRLGEDSPDQLWIPEGFAHGYCTLLPETIVSYKVTNYYSPEHERGLAFDDPDIAIDWPIDLSEAILSEKDKALPRLKDLKA